MAAKVGHKGKATLGSTKILGLGTWTISGIDADVLEDTEFEDTYKTYKINLREGGTIAFNGFYDPADSTGQTQLKTYWQSGTSVTSLRLYEGDNFWGSFAMDEQCDSITGWDDYDNDGEGAGAASTQSSNPLGGSLETFKFMVTTAGANAIARRSKDFGNVFLGQSRVDIKLYHVSLGTIAGVDYFELEIHLGSDVGLKVRFATDGLFVYDGSAWNEVGTNLVSTGAWQTWRFDVRHEIGGAAYCSVYLDTVIQDSTVDCSWTGGAADRFGFDGDRLGFEDDKFGFETTFTPGFIQITQYVETTNGIITYMDYLQAPTGHVNITSWDVSADKSALAACSFTAKVDGRLALQ